MKAQRLSVTFPAKQELTDLEPAIALFHRMIQYGQLEGLVLDVADYRHVPQGPGVVLVGHDVDYALRHDGLTVIRKRSTEDAAGQLRDAIRMGLVALAAFDLDGKVPVDVDTANLIVRVFDRKLGDRSTVEALLRDALAPTVAELLGPDAKITVQDGADGRDAPTVQIAASDDDGSELLERLGGSQAPGQSPWDIPVEELARLRESGEDFVLLDVREESEYETVNLGGKLIPLGTLADRLDELDPAAHVVVHCRAGRRSATAVAQLREAGFGNAWSVNGSLMAWIDRIDASLPRY